MVISHKNFEALVVDDDDMTVFLHEVHIKETNFHPSPKSFYNGKDVIDYFETYFKFNLRYFIFLDINMPILNGWEVLDALINKGMDKNITVIILTSSINTADRDKAKNYPMVVDYIEKPLSHEHIERLNKLLEEQ